MAREILCVSPYEGLNHLLQVVCAPYTRSGDIHFTFLRYDLQDDPTIIQAQLNMHSWDLIISRGATATTLRTQTACPVVDIGVSQYDLLNVLQSAQHLSHAALVAFAHISDNTRQMLLDSEVHIPLYSVHQETELTSLFTHLQADGIDTIICDAGVEARARQLGFNTLLITSSHESVTQALRQGLNLLEEKNRDKELFTKLQAYLTQQKKHLLLLDANLHPVFTSGLIANDATLAHLVFSTWRKNNKFINYQQQRYQLIVDTSTPNFTALTLRVAIAHMNPQNTFTDQYSDFHQEVIQYYQMTQSANFIHTLTSYAVSHQPVVIIGEDGTGKMDIATHLYASSLYQQKSLVLIDAQDSTLLHASLEDDSSALFSSNQVIVIKNFNYASNNGQTMLLNFINQTRLFDRNLLILTLTQSQDDGLSDCQKQLVAQARTIILPSLRKITGDRLSTVIATMINDYNRKQGTNIIGISDMAMDYILQASWPGNFSQLDAVLKLALAACTGAQLDVKALQFAIQQADGQSQLKQTPVSKFEPTIGPVQPLSTTIYHAVVSALDANQGRRTQTAEQLGISRATLWRYLKRE